MAYPFADSRRLQLTASAGVAPNKFLAKIASDLRKPDGLFVIVPGDVDAFLPRCRWGDCRASAKSRNRSSARRASKTVENLRALRAATLEEQFGSDGLRPYELAPGIDHTEVDQK